jgi:hypothetical protein
VSHSLQLFAQIQDEPFRSGIMIRKKLVDGKQDLHQTPAESSASMDDISLSKSLVKDLWR